MSEPDEPIFDPVRFGALVRRTLDRAGNDEALFEDRSKVITDSGRK